MKGQSNLEIARTPRNAFRCSLGNRAAEVLRSASERGTTQTTGQGPQIRAELETITKWDRTDSWDVGLEAAIHLKSA